jgi:cytochrome c-type protein NapB
MSRRAAVLALLVAVSGCARNPSAARTGAQRQEYRDAQRAYDGAPPVVPHGVRELARKDCSNCHLEGLDLGAQGIAPRTPHPERGNCLQCHVEQDRQTALLAANTFVGLRHRVAGTRAYLGAPPTVPHPRNGREGCLGCHGERGGSPIHTPHADRVNCLQCHVEQADVALFQANAFGGK